MPAAGLAFYRLGTRLLGPLAGPFLRYRAKRGKEDPERLGERLGRPSRPRPDGPLVWLHGVSVGESLMLATLSERLLANRPDLNALVTTGTRTAAEMMAKRLPPGAFHQYASIDAPGAVEGFFEAWRPDAGIIAESELWPNLLCAAKARGVRLALVNARMTETSLARWKRWPDTARTLLNAFETICAADARTFEGLKALGAGDIALVGNLKAAAEPPPADPAELATLKSALGDRCVWLAASTHPGEDEIVLEAHRLLRANQNPPLLILAPRHPERGRRIATRAQAAGFRLALRSTGAAPQDAAEVYIADTLGEMGLWLRFAQAVFMGGSLVEGVGGHNPLEPALTRAPMVVGPHTFNFEAMYEELIAAEGASRVHNAAELAEEIGLLMSQRGSARAEAAFAIAARGGEVLESVMGRITPLLPDARDARSA